MNLKPPKERKRNHVNLYLTDEDKRILDIVMKQSDSSSLDKMVVFALKRIYGNPNYSDDYHAILMDMLLKRQERLKNEITELKKLLNEKELDLNEITVTINEVARGENDGYTDN